jgi:hypothetical protein
MDETQEKILKKTVTRNYLQGFILASLVSFGFMIAGFDKIYWGYLALVISIWALFCGVLGVTTYFYQKSHPQLNQFVMQPKIQKGFSTYTIIFGFLLLLGAIKGFITSSGTSHRMSFVVGGFGLLTILWGFFDYMRVKKRTQ